jgi:hypothetical protein
MNTKKWVLCFNFTSPVPIFELFFYEDIEYAFT